MATYIHHIETLVPDVSYRQAFIREMMTNWLGGDRKTDRLLKRIYRHSGIEKRHSVIRDFLEGAPEGPFYDPEGGTLKTPGTGVRNEVYTEAARPLYTCLARRAVESCPELGPDDITHVITVSCTGFFAPGPDYFIVRELGLSDGVQRFHLGFMGCYAAFPALKMAQAFCEADPSATVLVVCLELCTLHFQPGTELDSLIATSVFADGGAAVLVSGRKSQSAGRSLRMQGFATTLRPEGEGDMAWTIGDTGFDMVLSNYVPDIIGSSIREALMPLCEELGLSLEQVDRWAVHPGGRAILDKVERGLGLEPAALEPSRRVLRDYGNMSSATVLFVLKEILSRMEPGAAETVYAMAFGPGLTVESGLFCATGT